MKVLSDWQTGKPPMPGFWLARIDDCDGAPAMMQWRDGKWRCSDGRVCWFQEFEWRGLAFNPKEAVPHYLSPEGEDWIVWVPRG